MNHLGKTSDEIRRFGRDLITTYGKQTISFEAAAQSILDDIYLEFRDEAREPLFALLRTFRLCTHSELPPEALPTIEAASAQHWLALMATVGQEAAWNDRRQSQQHRAIPAGDFASPMLKAAFEQINLDPHMVIDPASSSTDLVMLEESISSTRYFYVEQALGSAHIVDQEGFVRPYGIQSVLGMGSPFVSGAFHLTLFFSRVALTEVDVQLLMQLSPYITTLLSAYDDQKHYWRL